MILYAKIDAQGILPYQRLFFNYFFFFIFDIFFQIHGNDRLTRNWSPSISMVSVPPHASVNAFAIASPSPLPSVCLDLSPRKKRSIFFGSKVNLVFCNIRNTEYDNLLLPCCCHPLSVPALLFVDPAVLLHSSADSSVPALFSLNPLFIAEPYSPLCISVRSVPLFK